MVTCNSFPASSVVSWGQRRALKEKYFLSLEIIVYHLGFFKISLEASLGAFSILLYLLHFINKMAKLVLICGVH